MTLVMPPMPRPGQPTTWNQGREAGSPSEEPVDCCDVNLPSLDARGVTSSMERCRTAPPPTARPPRPAAPPTARRARPTRPTSSLPVDTIESPYLMGRGLVQLVLSVMLDVRR